MSQDRPQDRPGEPEPTRLAGGRPPQEPPAAQPPQQPQEPWTPAGAPPAGQSPQGGGYGQPPQGGGYGQPPQGGGYGQPPGGYGQPPQGGGYGQPPQGGGYGPGGPGYGGPGGPGGYGPPPGGFGPGGPEGPGGPRKPQDKKPLLIAGGALLALLLVGGLVLFFVLGGEDDGADTATDETSQEATDEATEEEEPTEEPSEEATEESEPETENPTFTSEDLFSSGPICDDRAMANASEYDPEDPRIGSFISFPESADYGLLIGPGGGDSWGVDSDRHEDMQVAMCLTATDQVETQTCEAQDLDENLVDYELVSATYTVEFVEATTGAVLAEGSELESSTQCPDSDFIFVSEEGETRFAQPSSEDLDLEANTFITEGADES